MKSTLPLLKNLSKYTIILASASPRRKQLLEGLGISFEVLRKEVDESFPAHLKREKIPLYLCEKKAAAFALELKKNTLLITADTIVWLKNKAINKPANRAEAIAMLSELSGKKHIVYTGVCIKSRKTAKKFFDKTEVYFKKLTMAEIEHYIDTYEPYDKAGAYGAQEFIGYIGIKKINGSYFNVMGLPVNKVYEELSTF